MTAAVAEATRPSPTLDEIADFEAWITELETGTDADREFRMGKIAI
ncbi:hypothetical protein ACFWA9_27310 [Kitasatospora sp. NPDC059973]